MEIFNKYDIIEGDDNNDSEELKEEYQEVISQLRLNKLDYDFIRKVLTIVSSLVIEYDFNTPEELKQIYEETLVDDTISAIRKFYKKDINTLIFSYSILPDARKAFLSSINFEEIKKRYQEKHIDLPLKEFDKFFKYAIKYVIVIQKNNNVIIRETSNVYQVIIDLNYRFSNVILYFERTKSNPEEGKIIDIKNKIIKRSCSQPRQNTSIQDYYDNAILGFSMNINVDKTKNTVKPNKQIEITSTQNKHENNIAIVPTIEAKSKIMIDKSNSRYLRYTKVSQNERNIGINKKDNNNYLNRNIDIMKEEQKIKTNLNDPKNNEAIGNGPLTQNNYGGLNKINLDLQNQTNIQETLKIDKVSNNRIQRQVMKHKDIDNKTYSNNQEMNFERNKNINYDNFIMSNNEQYNQVNKRKSVSMEKNYGNINNMSNYERMQNEEKMKNWNRYPVDTKYDNSDTLHKGINNVYEPSTFDKKYNNIRTNDYNQQKKNVNNLRNHDIVKKTNVYPQERKQENKFMVNQPNSKSNANNLHRQYSQPRPIAKPSNDLQFKNKSIGGHTQNNMLYSQGLSKENNIYTIQQFNSKNNETKPLQGNRNNYTHQIQNYIYTI